MVALSGGHFVEIGPSFQSKGLAHAHAPAHEDMRLTLPGLRGPESPRYGFRFRTKRSSWSPSEMYLRTAHSHRCARFAARNSASEDPGPGPNTETGRPMPSEQSASPESSGSNAGERRTFSLGNQQESAASKENNKSSAVQSALERAAEYKKRRRLGLPTTNVTSGSSGQSQTYSSSSPPRPAGGDLPQVEIIRRQDQDVGPASPQHSAEILAKSPLPPGDSSAFAAPVSPTPSAETGRLGSDSSQMDGIAEATEISEPKVGNLVDVKSMIEQKMAEWASNSETSSGAAAVPESDRSAAAEGEQKPPKLLSAFERAKQYKQQTKEMVTALREKESTAGAAASNEPTAPAPSNDSMMEIEIVTREGVIKRKVMNPQEQLRAFSNVKDVKKKGVTGIDFAGLGFADKKKSGKSAGLMNEGFVSPPKGPLPEVEILTRDAAGTETSQAGRSAETAKDPGQLYKPKVTSWGVFPRPANISKTYGGGRTIRPGESLETDEERKTREARTAQLLDEYRKKMGLNVDPAVKAEAQQIYQRGEGLMDNGRMREALLLYELAMSKMPPQSELHGLAALQAGLCLDSQSRYVEARAVYEKLLTHPTVRISKQARRFLFGFKAMEELKVDGAYEWDATIYRKYFDSFADGYDTNYKASEEEKKIADNLLPYVLLLVFPFLLVFALAVSRSG